MSAKKSMPKEVMEWVLEHIEYYCPMDGGAEKVMDEFVSNMYLENWEAASGSCGQILHLLGNDFSEYIGGVKDDRTIVSEYLDAHTVESSESKREYPIGYLKEREKGLEKKIKDKLSKAIQRDGEIDIKKKIEGKRWMGWIGIVLIISGVAAFWGILLLQWDWPGLFYISMIFIFWGYLIWRVDYRRKCLEEKVKSYYQEMISNMDEKISASGLKQGIIKLHRMVPKNFYDKYSKTEKETKKIKFKRMRKKREGSLPKSGISRSLKPIGVVVTIVVMLAVPCLRGTNWRSEQEMPSSFMAGKQISEDNIMPDENKEIHVQVKEIEREDSFAKEGVIFKDSNQRKLGKEEIEALKQRNDMSYQEALGYARNEIYARMGYNFNHDGGKYTEHYSKYKWYQDLKKRDITEDMFNQYERANIDLILKAEEELGKQE